MESRSRSRSNSSTGQRGGKCFEMVQPSCKIFVGGLSENASENQLKTMFSACGTITDFFFKKPETGTPFAFITYSSLDQAKDAIASLHSKRYDEKMISVKYAKPKPPREGNGQRKGNFAGNGGDRRPPRQFNEGRDNGGFNQGKGRNQREGGFQQKQQFSNNYNKNGDEERRPQRDFRGGNREGGERGSYNGGGMSGKGGDRFNNQESRGENGGQKRENHYQQKKSTEEDHDY